MINGNRDTSRRRDAYTEVDIVHNASGLSEGAMPGKPLVEGKPLRRAQGDSDCDIEYDMYTILWMQGHLKPLSYRYLFSRRILM